jgi:hypothetical protein
MDSIVLTASIGWMGLVDLIDLFDFVMSKVGYVDASRFAALGGQ